MLFFNFWESDYVPVECKMTLTLWFSSLKLQSIMLDPNYSMLVWIVRVFAGVCTIFWINNKNQKLLKGFNEQDNLAKKWHLFPTLPLLKLYLYSTSPEIVIIIHFVVTNITVKQVRWTHWPNCSRMRKLLSSETWFCCLF